MSEYGANAIITGSLNVDGNIDLGSGDDDVNLDNNTLFVDADQDKVGIGTTTPDYTLDVAGDIGVNQYIYHNGDADTFVQFADNKIILKAGNRTMVTAEVKSSQPHEVTINDGSNNVDFVVKGNGSNEGNPGMKFDASTNRLGINGVGSPDCELHVDGDVKVVGNDPRIKIDGDTDSHPGLELYENGTRKWITYNNYTNDNLTFKTNSDVRMVIAQDGNVGVGVGDPDTRLEVFNAGNQLKLSYNASDSATFAVDDNGYLTVTPSGGFASIAGQFGHRKYIKATMSNGNTIGTTESGAVVMQSTASDTPSDVVINLPATAAGVIYTFLFVGNPTHGFQISPNSSDKIMGSVVNAAGGITTASNGGSGTDNKDLILGAGNNSTVGNRVTLVGDGSNGWVILDGYGDWTFES
tara:strand:+ start:2310 stop:3539 length:1230 start_codon:yes stop_codon:yes gene_type:complete